MFLHVHDHFPQCFQLFPHCAAFGVHRHDGEARAQNAQPLDFRQEDTHTGSHDGPHLAVRVEDADNPPDCVGRVRIHFPSRPEELHRGLVEMAAVGAVEGAVLGDLALPPVGQDSSPQRGQIVPFVLKSERVPGVQRGQKDHLQRHGVRHALRVHHARLAPARRRSRSAGLDRHGRHPGLGGLGHEEVPVGEARMGHLLPHGSGMAELVPAVVVGGVEGPVVVAMQLAPAC